jgi:hypothetical protein
MQWAKNTIQDLRFALRSWAKTPAYAIASMGTLAIGIGANTAIFSVVSGVLLRPLPFAAPESLVQVYETQPGTRSGVGFDGPVVFQDFDEWRTQSRLLQGIVTYSNSARNFQGAGDLEQVTTISAERGLFELLGASAAIGRAFGKDDPLNVAVASYGFWRSHFDGNPSAIGRTLTLDGQPFTLIGVMPELFQFPYTSSTQDLWVPWRWRRRDKN